MNPFNFMDMISLQGKKNFFEKCVSGYSTIMNAVLFLMPLSSLPHLMVAQYLNSFPIIQKPTYSSLIPSGVNFNILLYFRFYLQYFIFSVG